MGINIGLDIGAISLKLAALGKPADRADPGGAVRQRTRVPPDALDGPPLLLSDYRRICGQSDPVHLRPAARILRSRPRGPRRRHARYRVSGSRTIAKVLGLFFENEFKAIARMIGDVLSRRCGRSSKSAARAPSTSGWSEAAFVDYDRSGECAAGTGSFLDQQALRMQYSVEEVGELVCDGGLRGADCRAVLACSPRAT